MVEGRLRYFAQRSQRADMTVVAQAVCTREVGDTWDGDSKGMRMSVKVIATIITVMASIKMIMIITKE